MQICDFIAAQLQILPVGKRQSCPKMDILRAKSRPLWQAGSRVLPVLYCEQSSRQSTKGLKGWDKANKVGYDLQKTIQRWPNLDFSAFRFPHGDKSSVQGFQFSVLKFFRFQSASFEVSSSLILQCVRFFVTEIFLHTETLSYWIRNHIMIIHSSNYQQTLAKDDKLLRLYSSSNVIAEKQPWR